MTTPRGAPPKQCRHPPVARAFERLDLRDRGGVGGDQQPAGGYRAQRSDIRVGDKDDDRLFAAGLDVFNNEPHIDPRYRELDNAFLLPHIGSAARETRDAMGFRALDNLDAIMAGREPRDRLA